MSARPGSRTAPPADADDLRVEHIAAQHEAAEPVEGDDGGPREPAAKLNGQAPVGLNGGRAPVDEDADNRRVEHIQAQLEEVEQQRITDYYMEGGTAPADVGGWVGDAQPRPLHNKEMAKLQLGILDPYAAEFTFQFFSDNKGATEAEKTAVTRTIHGTLDEVWPKVLALNTPQKRGGVFVTIHETDGKGRRKTENIIRTRALFVDADSNEAVERCEEISAEVTPSMVVSTANGRHYYWLTDDLPLDKFTTLQEQLNAK